MNDIYDRGNAAKSALIGSAQAMKQQSLVDDLNNLFDRVGAVRSRLEDLRGSLYGFKPEPATTGVDGIGPSGQLAMVEDRIKYVDQHLTDMFEMISELKARIIG